MLNPQSFQFLTQQRFAEQMTHKSVSVFCQYSQTAHLTNIPNTDCLEPSPDAVGGTGFCLWRCYTCVSTDVLYETSNALIGIVAVAALVLPIAGPLQAVQLHIRPFLRWHVDLHGR